MENNKNSALSFTVSILVLIGFFGLVGLPGTSCADDTGPSVSSPNYAAMKAVLTGGSGNGGSAGTVTPDLFTGTMSYSIPIEVPEGRHGMSPGLSLDYKSNNGNGWVGMGWELEVGAIERSMKGGVKYNGDDYVLRMAGGAIDLVQTTTNEYRSKSEGSFLRVKRYPGGGSDSRDYWTVTDKEGTIYTYGTTTSSRQDDPGNANNIFKWCLERVEDANGNYMSLSYVKFIDPRDSKQDGQIYLRQIAFTGKGTTLPNNHVNFYLESRTDAPDMYATKFRVTTAYRLKTIEVRANDSLVKAYALVYDADPNTVGSQYSLNTGRSLLYSVQQFDKNVVCLAGTLSGGTSLPAIILSYFPANNYLNTPTLWLSSDGGPSGPTYNLANPSFQFVADFNGDGKMDYMYLYNGWYVALSNGHGFDPPTLWLSSNGGPSGLTYNLSNPRFHFVADFNGDGKMDYMYLNNGWYVALSNGHGFDPPTLWLSSNGGPSGPTYNLANPSFHFVADFNGDGKMDYMYLYNGWYVALSNGQGFDPPTLWLSSNGGPSGPTYNLANPSFHFVADFNGDGKTDYMYLYDGWYVALNDRPGDLLDVINNGIGGTTTADYKSSTNYQNTLLPFPVQTVSSVTVNDGLATSATTTYDYSGGYYHIGQHDFRGFNHVTVTGPVGPNGEQTVTETWFHQGNEVTLVDEAATQDTLRSYASATVGYMKGKAYRTKVKTGQGALLSQTTTVYQDDADGQAPYFAPPQEINSYIYGATTVQTKTVLTYGDAYGNVTKEEQYGDVNIASDDRTVERSYAANETPWIVGLLKQEIVYAGIGSGKTQVSKTDYYFDSVSNCNSPSTNQVPTQGNVTRIVRWLNGGTSPEVWMAYDGYGNLSCTRDAMGHTASLSYDSTYTVPRIAINALGHQTETKYYGIDGEGVVYGLYGQVESVTDANGQTARTEYDTFGRKTKVTAPDGTWTTWTYNNFGTVGAQNSMTNNSAGIRSWSYFDGLGRTYLAKKDGPDGKVVAQQTVYNNTGTVAQSSLPYFDGMESPRWTSNTYVYLGTTFQGTTTNPDNTSVRSCADGSVTSGLDADGHLKRQTKDALGRLVKVEEFDGTPGTCSPSVGAYATTTYEYDVLGNLRYVHDAKGNTTEMQYDTLGQKTYMSDPDMGVWHYSYDANGRLASQTDAKNQVITFAYDPINRVTTKTYPDTSQVTYTYDVNPGGTETSYPVGRLSIMTDVTGTTKYYYDNMGRPTVTKKTIDGSEYRTVTGYEANTGRLQSIQYPGDAQASVWYAYNTDGSLFAVRSGPSGTAAAYATYAGYNSLGQPGTVTDGNGVTTIYQYQTDNNRLLSMVTATGGPAIVNLAYTYWNNGNIKSITDGVNPSRSLTLASYDGMNRLVQAVSPVFGAGAFTYVYDEVGNIVWKEGVHYDYDPANVKPHAVRSTSDGGAYAYDNNGNMTSDGARTIGYDYDNMPVSVTVSGVTSTFAYDAAGTRVMKISGNGTTVYVGKMQECRSGGCTNYIFAGGTRIAAKSGSDIYYYHQDHLGSTRAVTDGNGNVVEDIAYYPFGAAQADTGGANVSHKFTSQEFDADTGLYYYNARYYNPVLGRFISADTIVPSPGNPQTFNRYSYVSNNPFVYIDPSGHSLRKWWNRQEDRLMDNKYARAAGWLLSPYTMMYVDTATRGAAIAGTMGFLQGGPVGAVASVASYELLNNTGEGRQLVDSVAQEVFVDMFHMNPKWAHVVAYALLNKGLTTGIEAGVQSAIGTPQLTVGDKVKDLKDPKYAGLKAHDKLAGPGISGRNVQQILDSPTGEVYELKNGDQLVGLYAKDYAFGATISGLDHTALVVRGVDGGFFTSMSGLGAGNIYGITALCHNMSNQALALAGYSTTVLGLPGASWSMYAAAAVYGFSGFQPFEVIEAYKSH